MQNTYLNEPTFNPQNTEHQRIRESGLNRADLDALVKEGAVTTKPNIVSGAFVFAGTRVPIYNLRDCLLAGDSLDEFLESFPTVPRAVAEKAISMPHIEAILRSLRPGYVYRVELPGVAV